MVKKSKNVYDPYITFSSLLQKLILRIFLLDQNLYFKEEKLKYKSII